MASGVIAQKIDFYLVRHAPVVKPVESQNRGWLYGWTDLEADVSDTKTIEVLKQRLPKPDQVQVVTTDLRRTQETAIALGFKPHTQVKALREQHFGDWENTALSNLGPEHEIWQRPHSYTPPNGEAWTDVRIRVADWLSTFKPTHDKVMIVAHAGSLRALLATLLNIPSNKALAVHLDTLSLSTACHFPDVANGSWRVNGINWTP